MMRYVYGYDDVVAQFVGQLIPHAHGREFGPCSAIGIIDNDGKLVAGMVYSAWDKVAGVIELSGAALPGINWLTRETLRIMYGYPFIQLGCQMVTQHTPADNTRLLRQLAVLGFMFVTIPRLLGRDRDCVLCMLTREDWEENKIFQRVHRSIVNPIKEAA